MIPIGAADRITAPRTSALAAAVRALGHANEDLPSLLHGVCRLVAEALESGYSTTWLWEADVQVFLPAASHGSTETDWAAIQVRRLGPDVVAPLLERLAHGPLWELQTADAAVTAAVRLLAAPTGSVVSTALRAGSHVIGVQITGRPEDRPFTGEEAALADVLAGIGALAVANARLREDLERARKLRSEFLATMSHELRTPLSAILGYTEMLGDEQTLTPEARRHLDQIRNAGGELLKLVETTLELNRIRSGRDTPVVTNVLIAALWEEVTVKFADRARARGIEVRWEVPDVIEIRTDKRKLQTVLTHLVDNAIRFTPKGAVVISCRPHPNGCEFAVADSGVGIASVELANVFDMFRQVDGSKTRHHGGTGIGLYTVQRLVSQLGGALMVESVPGTGSTFRVVLPMALAMPERAVAT